LFHLSPRAGYGMQTSERSLTTMDATESIYGPSWYAATAMPAPEREPLAYDLDVDVCVIGGGLAGLTTARELARRGWSVAVLEARRVGWNASGRNAGFVAPGFAESPERIIERIGLERARALWRLSAGGVDYVRTTIRETQMPGVGVVDGWLNVQRVDNPERIYQRVALIGDKFGTEVEAWSADQVRQVLNSPVYFQALHLPGGFHIHALNYVLGLAAAAEEAGARIFEHTPALAVDPAGVRKHVKTPKGRLRASHVVLAGSAHLEPLIPTVSGSVLAVASYVATTAPLGERLLDALTYTGAVVDTRRTGDYYRIVDGDRLMWGSRMTSRLAPPRRLAQIMRRDILEVYPQLGEVEVTHAWTGTMGYAVHKMPQIGEVSSGLWVATAFGGHGLNTSAMAGELVARAIGEGDDTWRQFSSYDLVYAGGRAGRAAAQVVYWSMRIHDTLDEKLARRRDASRLRHQELAARVAEEAKRKVAAEAARLAAEEAERHSAAGVERLAALASMRRAADEAAFLEIQQAQQRAAEEAAQKAELLAAEEAQRQAEEEAERDALAAEHREAELAQQRAAEERARRAMEAAAREAADQSARMAADEAAHRIAQEAARLTAEVQRMTSDDAAYARAEGEVDPFAAVSDADALPEVPPPERGPEAPPAEDAAARDAEMEKEVRRRRRRVAKSQP
jgi:gamma-glutamylputrescine oxidase